MLYGIKDGRAGIKGNLSLPFMLQRISDEKEMQMFFEKWTKRRFWAANNIRGISDSSRTIIYRGETGKIRGDGGHGEILNGERGIRGIAFGKNEYLQIVSKKGLPEGDDWEKVTDKRE